MSNSAYNPQAVAQHLPSLATGSQAAEGRQALLQKYLGEPPTPIAMTSYDRMKYTNYDLPEAYKGRNLFIQDTISGLILEDNDWYTTVCLPWLYTEEQSIQWNIWHFGHTLADRVPHEGISRLVRSSKSVRRGSVVRRGLAFLMERDFYTTEEGQEHYRRNIIEIASAVQETQNHDTIHALLTCKTYEKLWEERYGRTNYDIYSILEDEIKTYAAVIQDEKRIEIVIEEAKRLMNKNRITPDMLILWPTAQIYLTMAGQGRETLYFTATEGNRLIQNRGPESLAVMRGLDVFETRDFDLYHDEPAVQLLTRPRAIGEYYLMSMREWRNATLVDYKTKWRDIYIYNENEDDWVKISFKEAFKNCGLFSGSDANSGYSRELAILIAKYNAEQRQLPADYDPFQFGEQGVVGLFTQDREKCFPLHFLIQNVDGVFKPVYYFGEISRKYLTAEDTKKFTDSMKSITSKFGQDINFNSIVNAARVLSHKIESEPYNENFFKKLVEVNSNNSSDDFNGIKTPIELAKKWGGSTNEFIGNSYGGLNLPQDDDGSLKNMKYPIGFNTWPGLQTLADEADNPQSKWKECGQEAKYVVEGLREFKQHFDKIFPSSESLNPSNRSPWFHKSDGTTTLFENIVLVPRDPVFIAVPKQKYNTEKQNDGGNSEPLIFEGEFMSMHIKKDGNLFLSNEDNTFSLILDDKSSSGKLMLPKMVHAKLLMAKDGKGVSSSHAFDNLMKQFDNENRNRLVSMITSLSSRKIDHPLDDMRKIVRGLDLYKGDKTEVLNKIVGKKDKDSQKDAGETLISLKNTVDDIEKIPVSVELNHLIPTIEKSQSTMSKLSSISDQLISFAMKEHCSFLDLSKTDLKGIIGDNYISEEFKSTIENYLTEKSKIVNPLSSLNTTIKKIHTELKNSSKSSEDAPQLNSFNFLRAPLSMSKTLLKTIEIQKNPLALPSDPSNSHLKPINIANRLNNSITRQLETRVNYTDVSDLHKLNSRFDHFTFDISNKHKNNFVQNTDTINFKQQDNQFEDDEDELYDIFSDNSKKKNLSAILPQERKQQLDNDMKNINQDLVGYLGKPANELGRGKGKKDEGGVGELATRFESTSLGPAEKIFLTTRCDTYKEWGALIDNDRLVPVNIILMRPSIAHDMASAILLKRGIETGGNLYGHQNFELGQDVATKMILGHFTFNSKAFVWKEQNVFIIPDIKPERYVGGHNTSFVTDVKDLSLNNRDRNSIIAVAIPYAEVRHPKYLDITGYMSYLQNDTRNLYAYSTAELTNERFHFETKMQDTFDSTIDTFFEYSDRPNTICLQGTQWNYNTTSNSYSRLVRCKGHRGINGDYPGAAPVWNGVKAFLEPLNPTFYSLE